MNATTQALPYHVARAMDTHADLMINAGEFSQAVFKVVTHHVIESEQDTGSPFTDQDIGGLIAGLKIIGAELLGRGLCIKYQLDQQPQPPHND